MAGPSTRDPGSDSALCGSHAQTLALRLLDDSVSTKLFNQPPACRWNSAMAGQGEPRFRYPHTHEHVARVCGVLPLVGGPATVLLMFITPDYARGHDTLIYSVCAIASSSTESPRNSSRS